MEVGLQKKGSIWYYLLMPEDTTPTGVPYLPEGNLGALAGWLKMMVWFSISILAALAIGRL